jgi:hypothetical protein
MFDDSFKGNSSVASLYHEVRRSKSRTRDMQKASAVVFILFSCLTTQARPALVTTIYVFIYLRLFAHVERWLVPKFAERSRVLKSAAKRYT